MLDYRQLVELGLSPDMETLTARTVAAACSLDFGLCSGALVRGRLGSAAAVVTGFGNPPAAFFESCSSLDEGMRDPVLTRLLAGPGHVSYDQHMYVAAGAADLWDNQASFGYRAGLAVSSHHPQVGEAFFLGFDRPDALPQAPAQRLEMQAAIQIVTVYAESALRRLVGASVSVELKPAERAAVQTVGAIMYTQRGSLTLIERLQDPQFKSAAKKLRSRNAVDVVLRAIDGGLIHR